MSVPSAPRVLLVNDDDDVLFLLERAVAKEFPSAAMTTCKEAHTALALVEAGTIDAIVTDDRMPGMSGVEMVTAIRRFNATIPILMFTAAEGAEADARAAGVTEFVANANWDDVRAKIRALVK